MHGDPGFGPGPVGHLGRWHAADLPERGSDGGQRDAVRRRGAGAGAQRRNRPEVRSGRRRRETVHAAARAAPGRKAVHPAARRAVGGQAVHRAAGRAYRGSAVRSTHRTSRRARIQVRTVEPQPAVGWQAPDLPAVSPADVMPTSQPPAPVADGRDRNCRPPTGSRRGSPVSRHRRPGRPTRRPPSCRDPPRSSRM